MFVHGNNLDQKEQSQTKYRDAESVQYLSEIRLRYNDWKKSNGELKGPFASEAEDDARIIEERVRLQGDEPAGG